MKFNKRWIPNNLMKISLSLIIIGFIIMSIDGRDVLGGNSFHQLTIAPTILILGYSSVIFAIMNPKKKN